MRPSVEADDAEEYECMHCGARVVDPDRLVCEECGGELRSLGKSRDL